MHIDIKIHSSLKMQDGYEKNHINFNVLVDNLYFIFKIRPPVLPLLRILDLLRNVLALCLPCGVH